jgi:hypothetical protein
MWFGVAPTPAPSPRTNTKAWHPPHCTCARHGGASSGRSELALAQSPRTTRSTTRHAEARPLGEISTGTRSPTRKAVHVKANTPSSQPSLAFERQPDAIQSIHQDKVSVVDALRSIADGATQRVHRLSRRLSMRQSAQGDSLDPTCKDAQHQDDRPEHEERSRIERDNNDSATTDGWPIVGSIRPRSRGGTATGFSRPTSSVRAMLRPLDAVDRFAAHLVCLATTIRIEKPVASPCLLDL